MSWVIRMSMTYKITEVMSKQIRAAMADTKEARIYRKLEAVALRGEGKSNAEAAKITGYNADYVSTLVSKFVRQGLEAISSDHRNGGNNRNLTATQEQEFLDTFRAIAEKGQIVSVGDIAKAYDKLTGKERVSYSTVYYLLHKQGWRMVMPRSQHPKKASAWEIDASKKLTICTAKQ